MVTVTDSCQVSESPLSSESGWKGVTNTLFKDYVKTFLKYKQEAPVCRGHVKTREEQKNYIEDYLEEECIQLELSKIRVNKAVRSCNKLLLKSLRGRSGKKTNMPSCEMITEQLHISLLYNQDSWLFKTQNSIAVRSSGCVCSYEAQGVSWLCRVVINHHREYKGFLWVMRTQTSTCCVQRVLMFWEVTSHRLKNSTNNWKEEKKHHQTCCR